MNRSRALSPPDLCTLALKRWCDALSLPEDSRGVRCSICTLRTVPCTAVRFLQPLSAPRHALAFAPTAFFCRRSGVAAQGRRVACPESRRQRSAVSEKPHFAAKAKSVIFLFMDGGPSQVDTFDSEVSASTESTANRFSGKVEPTAVQQHRQGHEMSVEIQSVRPERHSCSADLFPSVAQHVDDLASLCVR